MIFSELFGSVRAFKKNKKGERVREADGKRAKKSTLAPSLEGGGWGVGVIKTLLDRSRIKFGMTRGSSA